MRFAVIVGLEEVRGFRGEVDWRRPYWWLLHRENEVDVDVGKWGIQIILRNFSNEASSSKPIAGLNQIMNDTEFSRAAGTYYLVL